MKKPELTAPASQAGEISPHRFQAALCPTKSGGANLCLAPGCLRIRAMQRALSLHNSSNPETEEPGGMIFTLQQGRRSSKSALLFLSSPTCCLLCRCEGTEHKRSRLQTLIPSPFSQSLHICGSSGPKEASHTLPLSFGCQFTSALFTMAQPRPQLAQGDATDCHLCPRVPGAESSAPLSSCDLLTQPGLSPNYSFPNSAFSLHNSAYNCCCPKV